MMKEFFTKHADTLSVISVILAGFIYFDSKFESKFESIDSRLTVIEKDIDYIKKLKIDERLSGIEKDVDRIKTVLIMQRVWPDHLAEKRLPIKND